ncbi:putative Outer membrane autotransporter barrel domain protein [uncultured delta proteobacterium]|uniref:Putative Outer membrane autotransporter barrel domain protein n=1 Tax=uncultured delta proteobacterium TaxID=34034 RepID=A0A212K1V1_9DELT|nr:putative Outer membrane autotransporter barrel domain protein [uncultured delta proteobacterium]
MKPRVLLSSLVLCCLISLCLPAAPALSAPLTIQGGNGVDGTIGGVGLDGADNTPAADSGTSFDSISVIGGNGGNGGGGNRGGKGGNASQTLNAATVGTGSITVRGGDGGNTGTTPVLPPPYAGDEGGNATLTFSAGTTVTSTGPVYVYSGVDGAAGSWAGLPTLKVLGTLVAPSVTVENAAGDVSVSINTLDVSGQDTTLTSIGLTTSGNFSIINANLSGGRLLTIDNSAGAMVVQNLNVTGQGRLFVADGTKTSIDTLNANGANLTFVLPSTLQAGDTVAKALTANLTGTNIGLDYQTVRPNLAVGQGFTLLDATALTTDITTLTVQTPNGDIYTLNVSGNQLLAALSALSPTGPQYERLKAYAEGRAASLAFVNQGADLILNQGFGSALGVTSGPGFQFAPFAAASGGWSRYNTGSHVDVSGASMLAGLAIGNDAGPGRLTAGLFFEGGWGSYNSYNSFSNYASVDGDGDTNYYGGGILGRYDLKRGALSGLYFDASARLGRTSTDFSSGDIRYNGSKADFDSDSMYWGAHAGLGYQWSFTEKAMLDLSGKFIWTRQDSDSVSVHGDKVRFKDADSLRTRLGGRFNYAVCDYATPYVGAYWEHEFDGKQRSSVNGVGIGSPDLKGDTGVGELGLTIKPVKDSGFSMDLGVQGYTGVREGVTGSLQLKFEF